MTTKTKEYRQDIQKSIDNIVNCQPDHMKVLIKGEIKHMLIIHAAIIKDAIKQDQYNSTKHLPYSVPVK